MSFCTQGLHQAAYNYAPRSLLLVSYIVAKIPMAIMARPALNFSSLQLAPPSCHEVH